jgi:hypothetical protein
LASRLVQIASVAALGFVFWWSLIGDGGTDTKFQVMSTLYELKKQEPYARYRYISVQEISQRAALVDSEWVDWYCRRMAGQGFLYVYPDTSHVPPLAMFSLTDSLGIDHYLELREQRRARVETRSSILFTVLGSLAGAVLVAYFTYRLTWQNIRRSRELERDEAQADALRREFKLLTMLCAEMRENCERANYFLELRAKAREELDEHQRPTLVIPTSPTRLSTQAFDLSLVEYASLCSSLDVLPPLMEFYREVGFINQSLDTGDWLMGTNFVMNKLEGMMRKYNLSHDHYEELSVRLEESLAADVVAFAKGTLGDVAARIEAARSLGGQVTDSER